MTRAIQVLALALLSLLAGACASTPEFPEEWTSIEVKAPSDRVVWQLALLALQGQGYPLAAATDSGSRQVESGWKTDLQPFRGDGIRQRALVRMSPVEAGTWKIEARVRREHNQNLVSPLDPVRAEWEPAADDEAAAQILLMHIRSRLAPEFELAPEKKPEKWSEKEAEKKPEKKSAPRAPSSR